MSVSLDSNAGSFTTFMAERRWQESTWLTMMAESFKGIDAERAALVKDGPWTARTTSVQRWARVDLYG
jgi:hypothetical protein